MKALAALLTTLLIVSTTVASSKKPKNEIKPATPFISEGAGPLFCLDYNTYLGFDNKTYVEFYTQVSYASMQFIKNKAKFQASYEFNLTIVDEEDNIVEEYSTADKLQVGGFAETENHSRARVSMVGFTFEPGRYKVKATVTDKETGHSSQIIQDIVLQNFQTNELHISGIQLSQKIVPAEEGPFVKNSRFIEPNPVRTFRHEVADIFIYFEVYNLTYFADKDNYFYTCDFIISDMDGEEVAKFDQIERIPGTTSAHSLRIPVEKFPGGDYNLTIKVLDEANGQTSETTQTFSVFDTSVAFLYANEKMNE